MKQHEKAKAWRKRHKLTLAQLAHLTGYGPRNISWMERGETAPNGSSPARPVPPWVWQRYRMMCAGVDAQLRTRKVFDW